VHSPLSKYCSQRGLLIVFPRKSKLIGIASDHGGYELKQHLLGTLREVGYEVIDFGDRKPKADDDYPDVERGIAICGSGVGVTILANRIPGVRACLIHDTYSARQGVEDDDLNMICLGGLVIGHAMAWELVQTFLSANFSGATRHRRRLAKVAELENHQ